MQRNLVKEEKNVVIEQINMWARAKSPNVSFPIEKESQGYGCKMKLWNDSISSLILLFFHRVYQKKKKILLLLLIYLL